jgi:hypothetical protein
MFWVRVYVSSICARRSWDADEEDLIFPRTATRHGPKYQANVPAAPDPYNYPPGSYLFRGGAISLTLAQISRNEAVTVP